MTRCSNNYGPFQFPEKVIPLFVTNLIDGATVPLYGEGSNVRDWLHVDDHCRGIWLVLNGGRRGRGLQHRRRHRAHEQGADRQAPRGHRDGLGPGQPVKDRLGHDQRYSVDISKISDELGYRPRCRSSRASPRPSSGTAPAATGGSPSRSPPPPLVEVRASPAG